MKLITLVATILMLSIFPAFAEGDIVKGKKVFKKCKSCHMVGENAKKKVGPVLNDIYGAVAGTHKGFTKYSKNMKKAGKDGLVWNAETLAEFLTKPKTMIKKTKMSFKGLKKDKDVENILAYLLTFSPDYKPVVMKDTETEPKTDG